MLIKLNQNRPEEIIIIGAGLCGMMIALFLAKRGYLVEIYEKSMNDELHTSPSPRSAEIDLSIRGLTALKEVGLIDEILEVAMPTLNRKIIFPDNTDITIPHDPQQTHKIYNISRVTLYKILNRALKREPAIKTHYSHQLVSVDVNKQSLIFSVNNDESFIIKKYAYVLGTDGASSILRNTLNDKNENKISYSYVYKDIPLDPSFTQNYLSLKSMYKWISKAGIFLAHPKITHAFSGTLLLSKRNENHFIDNSLLKAFPIFERVTPSIYREFTDRPFARMRSTKVKNQYTHGILLLGDAAHVMLPFLGQGVNCAFEDCRLFNKALNTYHDNWEVAIKQYVKSRQPDTDAIIDMSEIEYEEFSFLYDYKKTIFIEELKKQLVNRYPTSFLPYRYQLAFTHSAYADVKLQHCFQHGLMNKIYYHFKHIASIRWDVVDCWMHNTSEQLACVAGTY